jgi:hypothetical protein
VTTGILTFITSWNEFLFAVTFTQTEASRTAPIAIANYGFIGPGTPLTLAASTIYVMPVLLLVLVFGPQIATGLSSMVSGSASEDGWLQRGLHRRGLLMGAIDAPTRALLLVLLLAALIFIQYGWSIITFPYSVDYGEGPLLAQTSALAEFQNIYRSGLAAPPYTISNYPPLYILVLTPFMWLFGPAFWYGRLVSWLSIVAACGFVAMILHTLTRDRLAAVVGGLSLPAIPYVSYWSPLYRVDSLALALSLGALYVLVRWPDRRWSLLTIALLLTAAVYTRQSYGLAAPLAAWMWLLQRRPRRRAFALVGLLAGMGLGLLALLNLVTGGGFLFNIVTANVNEFRTDLLTGYVSELWMLMPFAVVGTALFVALAGWWRVESWRLVAPYAFGAALSGLTIGKIGSNVNYLLEFSAAMCLALGALIAWQRSRPIARHAVMILLAVQLILLAPGSRYHLFTQLKLSQRADLDRLMRFVRQTDGTLLADEDLGLLSLERRPIYIQPFEVTQLARSRKWDQRPFLEAIDRQDFSAILIFRVPQIDLEKDRWTAEMLAEIERRYQVMEQIGNTYVYRPKGS